MENRRMPVLRRHGATAPDFASYDYAENLNDRKGKIDKSKSVRLYWKDPSGMELQISLRAPPSAVVSGGDRFVHFQDEGIFVQGYLA
jgi:hypothetical protein